MERNKIMIRVFVTAIWILLLQQTYGTSIHVREFNTANLRDEFIHSFLLKDLFVNKDIQEDYKQWNFERNKMAENRKQELDEKKNSGRYKKVLKAKRDPERQEIIDAISHFRSVHRDIYMAVGDMEHDLLKVPVFNLADLTKLNKIIDEPLQRQIRIQIMTQHLIILCASLDTPMAPALPTAKALYQAWGSPLTDDRRKDYEQRAKNLLDLYDSKYQLTTVRLAFQADPTADTASTYITAMQQMQEKHNWRRSEEAAPVQMWEGKKTTHLRGDLLMYADTWRIFDMVDDTCIKTVTKFGGDDYNYNDLSNKVIMDMVAAKYPSTPGSTAMNNEAHVSTNPTNDPPSFPRKQRSSQNTRKREDNIDNNSDETIDDAVMNQHQESLPNRLLNNYSGFLRSKKTTKNNYRSAAYKKKKKDNDDYDYNEKNVEYHQHQKYETDSEYSEKDYDN